MVADPFAIVESMTIAGFAVGAQGVAGIAGAGEAAVCVGADLSASAVIGGALVDVSAGRAVSRPAVIAGATETAGVIGARGVHITVIEIVSLTLVDVVAHCPIP